MIYRIVLLLLLAVTPCHAAILVLSANGSYSQKATLSQAAADADTAGKTVVVTSALTAVQSNISSATMHGWPADRTLRVVQGGSIGNTTTLRIPGPFEAGRYAVFNGAGMVCLGYVPQIVREWFPSTYDTTTLLQYAVDNWPMGSTVNLSPGLFSISGSGTAMINLTRNVSIKGSGSRGTTISAVAPGGNTTTDGIRYAVTDNGGLMDVRNQSVSNLTLYMTNGRHAISGGDTGSGVLPHFQFTVRDCVFAAGSGYDLYLSDGFAFGIYENNQFGSGVYLTNVADGQRVVFNQFTGQGTNPGLVMDCEAGTYSHIIQSNNFSNKNGAIYIINGSQVKILYNQMEQFGTNTGTYTAMVTVVGLGYPSHGIDIIGNNFGGGSNVNYNLRLISAYGTNIRDNVFHAALVDDIVTDSTSKWTRVGYNDSDGTATPVVSDSGVGSFGVNKTAASAVLNNSWVDSVGTFRFTKNSDGYVRFSGRLTGGILTSGTSPFNIPAGFKPLVDSDMIAPTVTGTVKLYVSATTGQAIFYGGAAPDATLFLDGIGYYAEQAVY